MPGIMVKLKCITNMHVGNGDINYNIIDNEVERDFVTDYPTINSSGVKGALREYFKRNNAPDINDIFGDDTPGQSTPGKLKILGADMISIAVRASAGPKAFYLVSTQAALDGYHAKCKDLLGIENNRDYAEVNTMTLKAEGISLNQYETLFGEQIDTVEQIYTVDESSFRTLSLPVLARNNLENGISKSLWYEEVVPHESIFCFAVLSEEADKELLNKFKKFIDKKVIQFGGNASIGYGLCKVDIVEESAN